MEMVIIGKEIIGCAVVHKSWPAVVVQVNQRRRRSNDQVWINPVVASGGETRKDHRQAASAAAMTTRKSTPILEPTAINLMIDTSPEKPVKFKVRAVATVRNKHKEDIKETIAKHIDSFADQIGRNVLFQLFSTEIDPRTNAPKKSNQAALKDWSKKANLKTERVNYIADFTVPSDFGLPGAITVTNKHQNEFFLETITIEGFACGPVHFSCNSWVQSAYHLPGNRIFFANKPYLPKQTPAGLRELREKELKDLRGGGEGERKLSDRIYDFEVYNDLGNPDKGIDLTRPVMGGNENNPYPRRCRTGRPPTDSNLLAESRVEKPLPMYVPRDERFEESKRNSFSLGRLKAVIHNLLPSLMTTMSSNNGDLKSFSDIDSLYSEGVLLKLGFKDELLKKLPQVVGSSNSGLLKYDTPKIISKDKFAWLRDEEFARQAVAGINPVNIERVRVFPPVSKLDKAVLQQQHEESGGLKEEDILPYLNNMTVQEAIDQNKLYMLDYHDAYFPFIDKINALDGRKAYATRTIFFLTPAGTLKPIAIELTLPPSTRPTSRSSKRVVSPPADATSNWVWQLAKSHVCSNDAGVHQLVNHWLRTHATMEPFILAAHRQLSAMHPIFKLLDPHMRYTLEINALARQSLISADGVIESSFTPGRYCIELSAAAYKDWRFDQEGLPADLIRRGMAVADPTQAHGVRLIMEDYPYAADGLLIWSAIENWVRTYVNNYYPDSNTIRSDWELQSWYAESINVGHADHSRASWWPKLATPEDLVSILTTLIWLASAQHAALNFGQYPYGGYVPNRPPMMRRLIPEEGDAEYSSFMADPQKYFLSALPSLLQATKFMAVVDTLSTHSPDEEYIGERHQPSTWTGEAEMVEAFYEFSAEIRRVEKEIERRNSDRRLKNRCGAGVLPYELLAPSSDPGVTCRGVPNSVSI
ncbi:linoleate 13S-lipoxygenase 3-1, chloroplastic-like isoform X2 [Impatiens glandulifera]|uniref:linoleate 13S-lipoxygenase 3-1, chloroplastic-like isoform X2 n=1 Tax=Impatiens glandulifera TaxID=253017 RepID=UPI001FB140F5|nr:linoleate 13S-lipoxygenase 3-1, chloroplastic-like isoform X2 [Impatiens glandulifera]